MNNSISLILPMYNEIQYLPKMINAAKVVLGSITFDYEIIIVDDASNDGSDLMASKMADTDQKIRVIHHKKNRKLGGSLKTGFSNATKDLIIYTDMDMPFDLAVLKDIMPIIPEFDILIGSRKGQRESFLRVVYSSVYNKIVNFLFGLDVKDVNFALKIFKRGLLEQIELKSEGSFINAEFLSKARKLKKRIIMIDVEYSPREKGISRLSSPQVILKILLEMVKYYPELVLFSESKKIYSRLNRLYSKASFRVKLYNLIRYKTCPFLAIKKFVPSNGAIFDLGCGTGIFLNILRQDSNKTKLFGFDMDRKKIEAARVSLDINKSIEFENKDISLDQFDLAKAKCVTLIDVMCYLNFNIKKKLLKKCYDKLDFDGLLIIKDIRKSASVKFLWVLFQEFIALRLFKLTAAKGLFFEKTSDFLTLLNESGFVVRVYDLSKGYLYPHILYVARKQ